MAERSLVRRFFGFTFIPLISFVAPLLVFPILSRIGGVEGWASIGIGQALGAFGTFTTSFGWNVIGSARIALEKDTHARRIILAQSLWTRGISFAVTAIVLGAISFALAAPGFRLLAALVTVATALTGLTISWYGVGTASPGLVLKFESIPMVIAMVCAAPVLLLTRQLLVYPIFMIVGTLVGLVLLWRSVFRNDPPPPASRLGIASVFRQNLGPAAIDATGGAYSSAPVPLTRLTVGVAASAGVASADKVYRYSLVAVVVVGNFLQGWVLEVAPSERRHVRQLAGIVAHAVLGAFGMLLLTYAGPLIATVLLGAAVVPDDAVFFWYGIAYFSISASTPFIRNLLIPSNGTRVVLTATLVSAVAGISAMVAFGIPWGATGVAAALALSEFLVVCILVGPGIRVLLRERAEFLRSVSDHSGRGDSGRSVGEAATDPDTADGRSDRP